MMEAVTGDSVVGAAAVPAAMAEMEEMAAALDVMARPVLMAAAAVAVAAEVAILAVAAVELEYLAGGSAAPVDLPGYIFHAVSLFIPAAVAAAQAAAVEPAVRGLVTAGAAVEAMAAEVHQALTAQLVSAVGVRAESLERAAQSVSFGREIPALSPQLALAINDGTVHSYR